MAANSEAKPVRDWQEIFPWLILFRSVRVAIGFRLLLLAALGLVGMVAGWRLCWDFVAYAPDETGVQVLADPVLMQLGARHDGTVPPWPWELSYRSFGDQGVLASLSGLPYIGPIIGTAAVTVTELTLPFQMLFRQDLTYRGLAYALVCCAWALVIWGYFGAMITRIVAVKLTQDEMVSFKKAGRFARQRCCSYMSAPLIPLLGIFGLGVPIALLGLVSNFDFGVLIAGVLWPLVLCIGFVMAILLIGLIFGWPMMYSTISTEGTDAFDAISRSYAYVFQRPFHYLFYTILATIIGSIGWVMIHGIIDILVYSTHWSFDWGLSSERSIQLFYGDIQEGVAGWGCNLIRLWQGFLRTLTTAFAIGFLFSGMTAVYLLLRRQVDGVELDEVQLDEEAEHGLPVLSGADVQKTETEGQGEN
ncbi:MAG: hypothetical protein CBB70_01105 [Planctomycetaceae bacterium TMED10]|nr:MAG: hypothetical protein CBB70_01105 [Planctomycetaceae bacterium TMED10]